MNRRTILAGPAWFNWSESQRMIAIGDELEKMGYQVIFLGEGHYDHLIGDRTWQRIVPKTDRDWFTPERILDMLSMETVGNQYADEALISAMAGEEMDIFRQIRPDAVLTGYRPTLTLSTRIAHLPMVWCLSAVLSLPYHIWKQRSGKRTEAGERPESRNLAGGTGKRALYTARRAEIAEYIAGSRQVTGSQTSQAWNRVLRRYGCRPFRADLELLKGDLNLMSDAPELFPGLTVNTAGNEKRWIFTGPILNRTVIEMPEQARRVLGRKKEGKKTVLVSMGSAGTSATLRRMLEALRQTDAEILVTNIGKLSPEEMVQWPEKYHFFEQLPLEETACECDFAVTSGGQGTMYAMMAAGCPFAAVPAAYEQELNIRNLRERTGCCEIVYLHELKSDLPERVVAKLEKDPGYREGARMAASIMQPYRSDPLRFGEYQAAVAIDRFLSER